MRALAVPRDGLVMMAVSVVLLSSAWPITKLALQSGGTPSWFALGRAGVSGVTAFLVLGALRRLRWPGRADVPALLAVGGLQIAGFFALAHAALAYVPAGRTAMLSNVTTIWLAPLSVLVLREAVPRARWLAAGLGLSGVVVLIGPWAIDWSDPRVLTGNLFLIAAAGSWSVAIVVVRRCRPALSMLELLPWCFLLASLLLAPLALRDPAGPGIWGTASLEALAYIGLIAGPIGTWCVMQAVQVLPVMVASVGFLATPAAGLVLSTVLLGEPVTADLMLGSALILGGVALATLVGAPK
jgi:drug/metabolite transporter (DMT)-like permease